MSDRKMHIKIVKKREGVFEIEGVIFNAINKEDALRKYTRRKK